MFRRSFMTGLIGDDQLDLGLEPDGPRASLSISLNGGSTMTDTGDLSDLGLDLLARLVTSMAEALITQRFLTSVALVEFPAGWAEEHLVRAQRVAQAFAAGGATHFIGKSGNTYLLAGHRRRSFFPAFWPFKRLGLFRIDRTMAREHVHRLLPEGMDSPRISGFLDGPWPR